MSEISQYLLSLADLLHWTWCPKGSSVLLQMERFLSFWWLNNIPLHIYTTSSLSFHLLMGFGCFHILLWLLFSHSVMSGFLFVTPQTVICQTPLSMGLARILQWVDISLLWGIFPTQGLNLCLLHCRQALLILSHLGSPYLGYCK